MALDEDAGDRRAVAYLLRDFRRGSAPREMALPHLGRGDGSFEPAMTLNMRSGRRPRSTLLSDLDDDGDVDVGLLEFSKV